MKAIPTSFHLPYQSLSESEWVGVAQICAYLEHVGMVGVVGVVGMVGVVGIAGIAGRVGRASRSSLHLQCVFEYAQSVQE